MKWALTLLCGLNLAAAAELSGAHTVYLMPMSRGLDQFLANQLTRLHVLRVVSDPAKADVILTDHLGTQFEGRLDELDPPPPTPQAIEAAKKREAAAKEKAIEDAHAGLPPAPPSPAAMLADTANKAETEGFMSVSGRGRGNIFLVDVKSRQVIWSVYDRPKNASPHELDHTAGRVVKELKHDLEPPKPKQ